LGSNDFRDPKNSAAFRTLWQIGNRHVRGLTGHLARVATEWLESVPLLGVAPLTGEEASRVSCGITSEGIGRRLLGGRSNCAD